jgi:hypothetical protein
MDWIEGHIQTLLLSTYISEETARRLFLRPVRVILAAEVEKNRTYRLAYTTTVNLLSRIFPIIDFVPIEADTIAITPWGKFAPTQQIGGADLTLYIGEKSKNEKGSISLALSDWKVQIDSEVKPNPEEKWNPILAVAGAAYFVSAATKCLLGDAIVGASKWPEFSILDFKKGSAEFDFDRPIEIGEVYMAGIGAVGSAFLYCLLAHGRCEGALHFLDRDKIDMKNLGRYPLFDETELKVPKGVAAKAKLSSVKNLEVFEHEELFQHYTKRRITEDKAFRIESLVSSPDKRETRRAFQHELPRRVWDASTGIDQVVLHANVYDPALACLECIYPERPEEDAHLKEVSETLGIPISRLKQAEPINDEDAILIARRYPKLLPSELIDQDYDSIFRDLCSAGELKAGDEVVLAPMSFVSMIAGLFLYLEFIKSMCPETFSELARPNYYQLNPHFPPNPYMREVRNARAGCTCQQVTYRNVFNSLWNQGNS